MFGVKTIVSIFVAAVCTLGAFAALSPAIPFLAVTGKPTEADLAKKVSSLRADGFDQFLIYDRSGLQYEYMGEESLDKAEIANLGAIRELRSVFHAIGAEAGCRYSSNLSHFKAVGKLKPTQG